MIKRRLVINKHLLLFILSLLIIWLFQVSVLDNTLSSVFRFLKYMMFLLVLLFMNIDTIDLALFNKVIIRFSIISIVFLLFQIFSLNILKINLSGVLIQFCDKNSSFINYQSNLLKYNLRPSSFFSEPAWLATYLLLGLYISLFINKQKMWIITLIVIGITICLSSTGIIGLLVIAAMYMKREINKISNKKIIISLLVFLIVFFVLFKYDLIDYFITRIFYSDSTGNRLDSYSIFYQKETFLNVLLGHGMNDIGEEISYLSSYPRIYYYFGILGCLVFLLLFINLFLNISKDKKSLFFLFLILNIGTEIIFGVGIILYLTNVLLLNNRKEIV